MLTDAQQSYRRLLKAIQTELSAGQAEVRQVLVQRYWSIGKLITAYFLEDKERAVYGDYLYQNLERDLGINHRTLQDCVRFHRKFQITKTSSQLNWSQIQALLPVDNRRQRDRLFERAKRQNLAAREIRKIVGNAVGAGRDRPLPTALTVQRGQLYTYQIIDPAQGSLQANDEYLLIDCGFSTYRQISRPKGSRVQVGDIVTTLKEDGEYRLTKSPAMKSVVFTFKAYLEKIVDADTLWVKVDLGFDTITRQKLRFRNINTPEIATPDGRRAKKFIEELLKPFEFVVIKTYKSDKYDRYLVDVFLPPNARSDEAVTALEGKLLNQILLEEGLAQRWNQ